MSQEFDENQWILNGDLKKAGKRENLVAFTQSTVCNNSAR